MVLTKPRTDALQHEYETDGYVTLRGVISTEDQVGFCYLANAMPLRAAHVLDALQTGAREMQ